MPTAVSAISLWAASWGFDMGSRLRVVSANHDAANSGKGKRRRVGWHAGGSSRGCRVESILLHLCKRVVVYWSQLFPISPGDLEILRVEDHVVGGPFRPLQLNPCK